MVDQVYLEFAEAAGVGDADAIALVDELDNVLVLRSLSKAYGLAGAASGTSSSPMDSPNASTAAPADSVGMATEVLALGALGDPAASARRVAAIMVRAAAPRRCGCRAGV